MDIQNHWSKDNILFLTSKKIINGVGNNKFSPNTRITRAEYMKMILKALNINILPKGNSNFTDVQTKEWYHDIVATASELGLITGHADHTFRPDDSITRQEMAAIAVRALIITKISSLLQLKISLMCLISTMTKIKSAPGQGIVLQQLQITVY